jgi:hypothetical protein
MSRISIFAINGRSLLCVMLLVGAAISLTGCESGYAEAFLEDVFSQGYCGEYGGDCFKEHGQSSSPGLSGGSSPGTPEAS